MVMYKLLSTCDTFISPSQFAVFGRHLKIDRRTSIILYKSIPLPPAVRADALRLWKLWRWLFWNDECLACVCRSCMATGVIIFLVRRHARTNGSCTVSRFHLTYGTARAPCTAQACRKSQFLLVRCACSPLGMH